MNMPVAFAQILKVDIPRQLVWGRATQECVDSSGEIMDYEKSVPHFKSWSAEMNKATGGLSNGNLRSMHSQVCAGKINEIIYNDEELAIDIVAHVVDKGEFEKVITGCYAGFSIGGAYGEKTKEGEYTKFVAKPSEISLVDRPCLKTATFFDVMKADGIMQKVEFKNQGDPTMPALAKSTDESNELNADAPAVDVAKSAEEIEYQVEGTAEEADALAKLLHDNKLSIGDAVKAVQAATEAPLVAALAKRYADEEIDPEFMAELLALEKVAARADVSPKEGESKYGNVKFADEKNNKYPIENEAHIRAAWNYINKEKNAAKYSAEDLSAIKGKIEAAWKAKIDKAGPPSADKAEVVGDLTKGINQVSMLGEMLQSLFYCAQSCKAEAAREGDNSDIPARLTAVAQAVAQIYKDMATEEADELVEDMGEGDNEAMQMAYGLAGSLAKAGARNSAADADMLQKMHDMATKLGAQCVTDVESPEEDAGEVSEDAEKIAPAGDLVKVEPAPDMTKMITDAMEPLNKALGDALAKIAKLEAQPLPTKGVLRVVSKENDLVTEVKKAEIAPIVERDGSTNAAATMFKSIHASGGAPLIGGMR